MKKILQKLVGSLKKNIPTKTVPTAPIPVHTAYAVPKGSCWVALTNNVMLISKNMQNAEYHKYSLALLVASFAFPKLKVKPTSHNPAIINMIQFIFVYT